MVMATSELDIEALLRAHPHLRVLNERVNVAARKSCKALEAHDKARAAAAQAHDEFIAACEAAARS